MSVLQIVVAPPDRATPDEDSIPVFLCFNFLTQRDPVGGGFTPRIDGGNEQHPVHDEDREDATPEDYEREIDRLDQAIRVGSDKKF